MCWFGAADCNYVFIYISVKNFRIMIKSVALNQNSYIKIDLTVKIKSVIYRLLCLAGLMLNYGHEKNGTILTKKIMEL